MISNANVASVFYYPRKEKMIELPSVFNGGFNGNLVETELKNAAYRLQRLKQVPHTLSEWNPQLLREKIMAAMGAKIDHSLPLDVEYTRTVDCGTYTIQCLSYQSTPQVRVTGNLYIPKGEGPFPAVINMHGHWEQGRLAARVQQRGHLLAQSGYVVLAVDAFGTGERCPEHGVYTSHGGLLGGAPFQIGESLMGLQVVDNMRGVDLLQTLPFVQKENIGACGASGGGNQTMWLAAIDERIKAAVPVVSVGTFHSYIICPNCVCEVLPNGMTITEEAGIIALAAPRAIMPINGAYDVNPAFNPAETRRTVDEAKRIFRAYGVPENLRLTVLEEPHAFSPEAQRAMLGWFECHLKGNGSGEPVKELPNYTTLPEEELMVYAKGTRPASVVSLPAYLERREKETLANAKFSTERLSKVLHLEKITIKNCEKFSTLAGWERFGIEGSDNRLVPLLFRPPTVPGKSIVLLGNPYKKFALYESIMLKNLLEAGHGVALFDLWGGGENDLRLEHSYRDRFYNRALMWLGKNLQGKWVEDFKLVEEFIKNKYPNIDIDAGGFEEGTIAAVLFGALRCKKTSLYLTNAPTTLCYRKENSSRYGQGFIIPQILTCGDMEDFIEKSGGTVVKY